MFGTQPKITDEIKLILLRETSHNLYFLFRGKFYRKRQRLHLNQKMKHARRDRRPAPSIDKEWI